MAEKQQARITLAADHHRPHSSLGGTPRAVVYRRIINATQPDQQVQKVA